MKTCTKCGRQKEFCDFSKDKSTADGLRTRCRECMAVMWKRAYDADPERWRKRSRDWNQANPEKHRRVQKNGDLKTRYGISLQQFEEMKAAQLGCCAICEQVMNPPCVDHDHKTGKVRALLCSGCNTALGGLRDSPQLCFNAAEYLFKFSS